MIPYSYLDHILLKFYKSTKSIAKLKMFQKYNAKMEHYKLNIADGKKVLQSRTEQIIIIVFKEEFFKEMPSTLQSVVVLPS